MYAKKQYTRFLCNNVPVISVDTKRFPWLLPKTLAAVREKFGIGAQLRLYFHRENAGTIGLYPINADYIRCTYVCIYIWG